jgi:hypothetical protein
MCEEIPVEVSPMEAWMAVVENGPTRDIHSACSSGRGGVGNSYDLS